MSAFEHDDIGVGSHAVVKIFGGCARWRNCGCDIRFGIQILKRRY